MVLPSSMLKPRDAKSTGPPRFHSVPSCSTDSPGAGSTVNFSFHFKGIYAPYPTKLLEAGHRDGRVAAGRPIGALRNVESVATPAIY
jgi:hypothetical protein